VLLLVTILLVVVGTISLVIGFVQSSLLPIYVSIACSVLAAVVLLIFSRMTAKSQQTVTSGDGPAPLDYGRDRGAPQPAFTGTGLLEGSSDDDDTYQPADRYGSSSRYSSVEADPVLADDDEVVDDDFPIERYDARRVGEILPLLAELDLDELDIVREHEEQGKSRATVLARIDQLIDQLEAEDRQEAATRFDDTEAVPVAAGRDELDAFDDEPLPAPVASTPPQSVTVAALPDEDDGYFPIEDYDDLRASEILPLLPELDDDELEMVQERESSGAARSSILRRIETLLGEPAGAGDGGPAGFDAGPPPIPVPGAESDTGFEAEAEPLPMPVFAEPPPAKRAPARKTPAKRAPAATKVVVASSAPPVKKAAAKKATVTKAVAAAPKATRKAAPAPAPAVPVKKAPARGGATKATVAKKVPATKTAATTKAAPTKAAPTKAAAAKATAAKSSTGASKAVKAAKATKATKK
jgi:hypothetical protein